MDILLIVPVVLVSSIFLLVLWGLSYNKNLRKKGDLVVLKDFNTLDKFEVKIEQNKYKLIRLFVDYSISGFKRSSQKLEISLIDAVSNSSVENQELFAHNRSDLNYIDFGQLSLYTKGTEIVKLNTQINKEYILKITLNPKQDKNVVNQIEVRGYLN